MKIALVSCICLAFLAGCAAEEPQVAQADCKVAAWTPKGVVNKAGPTTDLDRQWAQAQLRSSGYRREELRKQGEAGTVENALNDCR
jgi:hypothetical protein